ncbi:MAG: radical SAM protein [Chitinivibrionia bacterium]|nr:radical SAM protein [Chitinivibrionia bacterium]
MIKIKFIYPKFYKFLEARPELAEFPAIAATWAYTMPPSMAIPILAKLCDSQSDIQYHIQDQNVEEINFNDDSDIIAISFFTPQAAKAYELGDKFLSLGKTVFMGGMHPSMIPDDVQPHCTSLTVGEGDTVFLEQIDDYRKGRLKPRYQAADFPTPEEIVRPKKGIFEVEKKYDWHASLVSVTRGCPFSCEWCNIPIYQGERTRLRPMDEVVEDIRELSGQEFYVTDDMIMLNRPRITKYVMELCDKIKDFNVKMFLSCSPAMNSNPEFLDKISEAGAKSMYTVFASDPFSARFYEGDKNVWNKCVDLVKQLEDRGIRFFGSFAVGFDCCHEDQFDKILEFCRVANVKTAEFFIATPWPNTPMFKRLQAENRLYMPIDWSKYNAANVVFKPKHTTEQQLNDGFVYVWKEFFKDANHLDSLSSFTMNTDKILQSLEYSQEVKDAVQRGLDRLKSGETN